MEYNILQQKSHLPTTRHLTIQFYSVIVLILTLHTTDVWGSTLGSKCQHDMDCTDFIKGSSCSAQGYCECAPYFVQYNTTTCLSSQLLGGDCTLNEQCTMKVANSSCLDGACRCVEGFLQFRKHTCLGPAPPGSVCYSHAHCQMFSSRTHCDFLIPNLFGRCQCTAPAKLKAGLCVDNTVEEAVPVTPTPTTTTTSTTSQPLKETELPLVSQSSEQEQPVISTSPSHLEDSIVTIATKLDAANQEIRADSQENISVEEQALEDDNELPTPTSKTPLDTPAEPLTPAAVELPQQLEVTEANDAIALPQVSEDYPYKIENGENHTQKPANWEDFPKETTLPDDEDIDHSEEYGHVIDNTMNFDYEAAQEEMEDHLETETVEEEKTEQDLEDDLKQQHSEQEPQDLPVMESEPEPENPQEIEVQTLNEQTTEIINAAEQPAEQEHQDETNQEPEHEDENENISASENNTEEKISEAQAEHENEQETQHYELEQIPESQQEEVQAEEKPEQQPEQPFEEQENNVKETEQLFEDKQEVERHEQPHEVFDEENEQQTHLEDEHEQPAAATVHDETATEPQYSDVHGKEETEAVTTEELQSQEQAEQFLPTETAIVEDEQKFQDPKPEQAEENEEVKVMEAEIDQETIHHQEANLPSDLAQDLTAIEEETQPIKSDLDVPAENAVSETELEQEYPQKQDTYEQTATEDYAQEHEELQEETQEVTNPQEPEDNEHEEKPELINSQEAQHVSEIETPEQELENPETFDSKKESQEVGETQEVEELANEHELESDEAAETKKELEGEQIPETMQQPTQVFNPELDRHESLELDYEDQLIKDDKYVANENMEQTHDEKDYLEPQRVNQQDDVAQLVHTSPDDSNEVSNNLPPKQQQQQQDNLEEEPLTELENLQSITNEIHHDQNTDVYAAESESVQNENEATTQQQMPEATEQPDDETVTTQPAKLEEQEDENNQELEEKISQEQQQPISDTLITATDDFLVSDDQQHQSTNKENEKFDENNTEGQTADTNTVEQQQETTETVPEVENYTDKFSEDIIQQLNEHFAAHQEDKQITEINQINHVGGSNEEPQQAAFEADNEKPNEIEQQPEFATENSLQQEEVEAAESQNISQEEVNEIENHTLLPPQQDKVAELIEDAVKEDTKDPQEMLEVPKENDSSEHLEDQNEIQHLESQETTTDGHQQLLEIINSNKDFNQAAPEYDGNSHLEFNYNENEEDSSENEPADLQLVYIANEPSTLSEHIVAQAQASENENEVDTLMESTTLLVPVETEEADSLENVETNKIQEEAETAQMNHSFTNKQQTTQEEPADVLEHKNEDEEGSSNFSQTIQQEDQQEEEVIPSNIETNPSVPSQVIENNEEFVVSSGDNANGNEVIDQEYQVYPTKNPLLDNKVPLDIVEQAASIEEGSSPVGQPDHGYLAPGHLNDLNQPENQEFKESESISDILNNLMKEDVTLQPEYNEDADMNEHLPETDVADLLAEDTNISEESVLSQQLPAKDSTEAPIDPEDKLITFYPDMQELQPVQQMPITTQQELAQEAVEHKALEEASGDEANKQYLQDNEINKNEEYQQHTVSPLDVPFDTSVDYEPQQFEADNLVVETTTLSASELKPQDSEEAVEFTTKSGVMDEVTTQTMLSLASRVTLMEPAALVSTTLKPLVPASSNNEATAVPLMELLLTTKPSTEIRKRVELSLEAVSLGLSCSNSEQCRLADPHTICNARGICDCAANVYKTQPHAQCGAEKTGCAPGTFQCRSSGVCISWFFVCDGRSDCNDASDEECTFNARRNQTCPSQAFQCGQSGRCISRAALCDGHKQCPQGEDEAGCNALRAEDSCPPNTFRCKSGECLPEYEYCNAIISCRDGSDEPPHLCGSRSMPNFFLQLLSAGGLMDRSADNSAYCPHRCSNGRCRSTAIVCSGRDGCGDGTDEQTCSVCKCPAVNMEAPAITVSEYLARHHSMSLW